MYVQIQFTVKTTDYGKEEFKREVEKLVKDIDPYSKLVTFDMHECNEPSQAMRNVGRGENQ